MKNKTIYINTKFSNLMSKFGLGIVEKIEIYRKENNKVFFKAGSGRFHMEEEELEEVKLKPGK